ncbi:AAA family ATPase, partial [Vibrio anguillarum]
KMKITSLTVGGFKGIKNKATIPLAPITLFFGANSTGKSTVLHALLYLYEVIAKRNFDAQYSSIAGESLYFGGFHNIVHGKDLNGVITLGATLDFRDGVADIWDDYLSSSEQWLLESHLGFTPDS